MADIADQKANVEHALSLEDGTLPGKVTSKTPSDDADAPIAQEARRRGMQPPAIIANLTREERNALELRLRKKIDLRLLPMIILMYIMNYIDRRVYIWDRRHQ